MVDTASAPSFARGPSDPPVRAITVGDLLRQAVEEAPDRVALIAGTPAIEQRRQWTYAELLADAERAARALLVDHRPGDRVAVWAPNIPEWTVLEFGCALAGIVLVTVNPAYRASELQYVLHQSRTSTLFVLPSFRGNPMLATAEAVQPECPELTQIISFDDWDRWLTTGDAQRELPEVKPQDPVMIQYTSGTTGFAKGAYLTHIGIANNGTHVALRMGCQRGGVWTIPMPMFHTGGSVCCTLGAVATASTMVLVEAFDPGLVLELIETYRATAMLGVPTMIVSMMEHPSFADRDLSSLETVCSGGSLVPAALVRSIEAQLGAPFTIVFGQTETSPVTSMTRPDDSIEDKATTIGAAMPGVEIKIVDPDTGETVPTGAVGEYCTRGYQVMRGYFDMPDRTAETIDAEGWLHTGDLCAMDERGYCTVEGRLKDMIIRGGENIYPKELEEMLFEHPSVGEVAVVGLPDERFGETVAAFIRPAPSHDVEPSALFAYMRERLAPHKTPRQWFSVDEFPMTGSGKIQKFKLRERFEAGEYSPLTTE